MVPSFFPQTSLTVLTFYGLCLKAPVTNQSFSNKLAFATLAYTKKVAIVVRTEVMVKILLYIFDLPLSHCGTVTFASEQSILTPIVGFGLPMHYLPGLIRNQANG